MEVLREGIKVGDNIHAGHREKLRERFIHDKGFENFEDHQILELLLFYANTRSDTNPLAHELLDHFGSLKGVLEARPEQLMQVKGIGPQRQTRQEHHHDRHRTRQDQ